MCGKLVSLRLRHSVRFKCLLCLRRDQQPQQQGPCLAVQQAGQNKGTHFTDTHVSIPRLEPQSTKYKHKSRLTCPLKITEPGARIQGFTLVTVTPIEIMRELAKMA